ncbi:MAG: hypothetical protein LQ352_006022 [Teloschistes flavicans]|nr:MAG: hypothetical protein LQ352_006022 [Teloschistes flavicans]
MVTQESLAASDAQICQADALKYWNSIPATVNGMLGGFPHVSRIDLRGSSAFFEKLRRLHSPPPQSRLQRGVDCGAGIGRVTAGFLTKVCQLVDIVEPVEKFASEVRHQKMSGEGKVGEVHVIGLQDWIPSERYDVIWIQWCLGHLTDQELEQYLSKCLPALKSGGWIVVKENVSSDPDGEDIFDEQDSSVTRTDAKFRSLFEMVGLKIMKTEAQTGFPRGLYPVRFYALQPE